MARAPKPPRARGKPASASKWITRVLVAIIAGIVVGAGIGVVGVRTIEPGNPGTPDSLQILLDSVSRARVAAEASAPSPTPAAIAARSDGATGDTVEDARREVAISIVPDLVGVPEGEARRTLEDLGFDIGTVAFLASPKPAGSVLSTTPSAGERITLPASVNLVLSNGRERRDSASTPDHPRR